MWLPIHAGLKLTRVSIRGPGYQRRIKLESKKEVGPDKRHLYQDQEKLAVGLPTELVIYGNFHDNESAKYYFRKHVSRKTPR